MVTYNEKKVLFKIYCNDQNMDKIQKVSRLGFGAKILHSFDDGRIEEWIDGSVLSHENINGVHEFHSFSKMDRAIKKLWT